MSLATLHPIPLTPVHTTLGASTYHPPLWNLSVCPIERLAPPVRGGGVRCRTCVFSCAAKSWRMLSGYAVKRHLIILPPQKGVFLGGWFFLDNFMNFWVWNKKKFLVQLWSKPKLLGYKSADFGQFMAIWNSKNLGFSVFLGKFGNFFFQNAILGKIGPRIIKNEFSEIV